MIYDSLPTPIHIIDLDILRRNLYRIQYIKKETGCRILFAIKGFSCDAILSEITPFIDGISASGSFEARLGKNCTRKYVQTFSPAIKNSDLDSIVKNSSCVVFNSVIQWKEYHQYVLSGNCLCGIRINPEYSVVKNYKVDPCHIHSRFGVRKCDMSKIDLSTISGLLFHNMCELGVDELEGTLEKVGDNFSDALLQVQWVNIGGGQLFTDNNYDLERAIRCLNSFRKQFNIELYMEPCTAVMYNSGVLVASIIDIVDNEIQTAILDASAICHLPDIVNFPYRSEVLNSFAPYEKEYTYRLAGSTCYSGDIFGDYSFTAPLSIGQKVIFLDTAQYSMVKSIQFNGTPLPAVGTMSTDTGISIVKSYDYNTFLSTI